MNNETYDQIYSRDNQPSGASGNIQWKGTDVCMDIYCLCGAQHHHDGEFFYSFECPSCHRKFAVGRTISLIELTAAEIPHFSEFTLPSVPDDCLDEKPEVKH